MKVISLQDVYNISQGVVFARLKNDAGTPVRVIQTRNLNTLEVSGEVELVLLNQIETVRRIRAGDIVINLKSIPVRASVATEQDAGSIASSNIAILTPKPDGIEALDSVYLVGLLKSPYMNPVLTAHMGGEGISAFNLRTLRTLPIPAPPIDKQLAFSKAFRALEQYRDLAQKLVAAHTERLVVELTNYFGGSHDD